MLRRPLDLQDQIKRTIHHELGHWLMARHFGFDDGEIKIIVLDDKRVHGTTEIYPVPKTQLSTANEVYEHLLRRITVLCAGVAADIEWHQRFASTDYNNKDTKFLYKNGVMDHTGLSDKGKIEEHLYIMNGIKNIPNQDYEKNTEQRDEILNSAWVAASVFLDGNKDLFRMGEVIANYCLEDGIRVFDKEYLDGLCRQN